MSLNIKNPETHRLVRELAEATGLSQTAAVQDAVQRRLDELGERRQTDPIASAARMDRARRIAAAYAADLTTEERVRIQGADAWLYDEDGLPR